VHRVGPDPGRQGGKEQVVLVVVVQRELLAVLAVEGGDARGLAGPRGRTDGRDGQRRLAGRLWLGITDDAYPLSPSIPVLGHAYRLARTQQGTFHDREDFSVSLD
jgi:hypothetical protein